jgi:hypothetical protein
MTSHGLDARFGMTSHGLDARFGMTKVMGLTPGSE